MISLTCSGQVQSAWTIYVPNPSSSRTSLYWRISAEQFAYVLLSVMIAKDVAPFREQALTDTFGARPSEAGTNGAAAAV